MTKDEALRMALEALENNRQTHNYCEDSWYSCPKHEDGCANDSEGDECNCGADNVNAQFDKAINAIKEALAQPEQEFFVVKHYSADERPTIKGNGFDGLEVGTDREDAEKFIKWVNARISTPPQPKPEQESDDLTIAYVSGFHDGKNKNAPQRKPLTDEQLIAAYDSEQQGRYGDHIRSLRAIEAAHGIKGE